jgi:hypothetical protein
MPLQVGVAFGGAGHGVQEAPQEATDVLESQRSPHAWVPASHVKPQLLPSQVAVACVGGVHGVHEAPQLATEPSSAHAAPHS